MNEGPARSSAGTRPRFSAPDSPRASREPSAGRAAVSIIDAHLRRLARREGHARLEIGRLAARFLLRRGHLRLGFARSGDYARERLGVSTSRLYELASVATSLASLPAIEKALESGAISWTQARELSAVAAPDTQDEWLAVATRCTADELRTAVAGARSSRRDRSEAARADQDDEIDGEPAVAVTIRCPRSVRVLWWDVVRLSWRVAGTELTTWQSAEAIAAEGLSATGWPLEEPSRSQRRVAQPACSRFSRCAAGARSAVSTDGHEHATRFPPLPPVCAPASRAYRDHLTRMAMRSDRTPVEQLDTRMRSLTVSLQRIDADIGALLCRVIDGRLHRSLGYSDIGDYCRNALGMCRRKAYALVAIERARRRTRSRIMQAYRSGMLSWHRCLLLLPVLTERTADAWIERAQLVTARRLADEVMWARMAWDAGTIAEPLPPRLRARLNDDAQAFVQIGGNRASAEHVATQVEHALLDAEIRFYAPASVAGLFLAALDARRRRGEPAWVGLLRLVEEVRAYWLAAPRHRDPVFARDGWRCAVPGCSSRRNLHDHHVKFRSQGGGNERDNRVTVCASHHYHGLHGGVLWATGKAGVGLDWALGRTAGGYPLMRISGRGEVYLTRAVPGGHECATLERVSA